VLPLRQIIPILSLYELTEDDYEKELAYIHDNENLHNRQDTANSQLGALLDMLPEDDPGDGVIEDGEDVDEDDLDLPGEEAIGVHMELLRKLVSLPNSGIRLRLEVSDLNVFLQRDEDKQLGDKVLESYRRWSVAAERNDLTAAKAIGQEFGKDLTAYFEATTKNTQDCADATDAAFQSMMVFRHGSMVQHLALRDIQSM
jgi:hypothetical protein